jgi:hypothetical protein
VGCTETENLHKTSVEETFKDIVTQIQVACFSPLYLLGVSLFFTVLLTNVIRCNEGGILCIDAACHSVFTVIILCDSVGQFCQNVTRLTNIVSCRIIIA